MAWKNVMLISGVLYQHFGDYFFWKSEKFSSLYWRISMGVHHTSKAQKSVYIYGQKMNWFKTKNIFLPWCLFSFFSLSLFWSPFYWCRPNFASLSLHWHARCCCCARIFFLNLTCYSAIPTPGREPEWLKKPFFLCPSSCCNFLWAWK